MAESAWFRLSRSNPVSWLRRMKSESADVVVADPARMEPGYPAGPRRPPAPFPAPDALADLFPEIRRVLRRDRHFYLFCGFDDMFAARPAAENAGFRLAKAVVLDGGMEDPEGGNPGLGYLLLFENGCRIRNGGSLPGILSTPVRPGRHHDGQSALFEQILKLSSYPGELVLDPFLGAGALGAACAGLGRNYWGCDSAGLRIEGAAARIRAAGGTPSVALPEADDGLDSAEQLSFVFQDGPGEES